MAKGGNHTAFTEAWFIERNYTPDGKGGWNPPPIKSNYIREKKGLDIKEGKWDETTITDSRYHTTNPEGKVVLKPISEQIKVLDDQTELNCGAKPLAVFNVNPIGKPRMTQRDKWDKRKNVQLYWKYKAALLLEAKKQNFIMPESGYHIICYIQMPHSWPEKKKNLMNGAPHQQKPDKDNIEKGILDALLKEDSGVWDGRITKYWGRSGKIAVYGL